MNPFDKAIALQADVADVDDLVSLDEVTWSGFINKEWSIGRVPNGGYSSALVLSAMLTHTGMEVARSLTNHYYRPAVHGEPCTIVTEVRRRGRSMVHCDATLIQQDKVRLRSIGVFGSYPSNTVVAPVSPTEIPPPERCSLRDPGVQGFHMSLLDSLEVRIDPAIEATIGNPEAEPRFEGWVRFVEPRRNDALALALFADAFPPPIVIPEPDAGWVPTIELTTHIRARAVDGWIRAQVKTSNIRGGMLLEDAHLWDATGQLVAQSRQLAMLLEN